MSTIIPPAPSSPTPTTEACAALASFTVRIFTPSTIASIRQIFLDNPRLSLKDHLPLLGKLVVTHVSLSLHDHDLQQSSVQLQEPTLSTTHPISSPLYKRESKPKSLTKRDSKNSRPPIAHPLKSSSRNSTPVAATLQSSKRPTNSMIVENPNKYTTRQTKRKSLPNESCVDTNALVKPPLNLKLPDIPKRASYRDLAYQAVREKRIVPAAVLLEDGEEGAGGNTNSTSTMRRLSVRISRGSEQGERIKKGQSVTSSVRKWERLNVEGDALERGHVEVRKAKDGSADGDRRQRASRESEGRRRPSRDWEAWKRSGGRATVKLSTPDRIRDSNVRLFPRATVDSCLESASRASFKPDHAPVPRGRPKNAGPVTRMVQLRRSRFERKGKAMR